MKVLMMRVLKVPYYLGAGMCHDETVLCEKQRCTLESVAAGVQVKKDGATSLVPWSNIAGVVYGEEPATTASGPKR